MTTNERGNGYEIISDATNIDEGGVRRFVHPDAEVIPMIFLIVRGQYDDASILCAVPTEGEAERYVRILNNAAPAGGEYFKIVPVPVGVDNMNGNGIDITGTDR